MILHDTVGEKHLTLHTDIQSTADSHNEEHHHRRLDPRQRNVPDSLRTVRTVHLCRLIKPLVDSCHCGEIYNRIPADFLPDIDEADDYPEQNRVRRHKL